MAEIKNGDLQRQAPLEEAQCAISKRFRLEAAHWLPRVRPGHPCGRIHGHSWTVVLEVMGPIDETQGWVQDFDEIKSVFAPFQKQLDHQLLNEIKGLENPTSENLARWIWERVKPRLPNLSQVRVQETENHLVSYPSRSHL